MYQTPRLRSAFPATPRPNANHDRAFNHDRSTFPSSSDTTPRPSPATKPVQNTAPISKPDEGPLVSFDVADAPTQRFYVFAFYILLLAWRLFNAWNVTDDLDSTWLFLKWLGIDAAFFVALPALRIPWLEWSFLTTLTIWLLHVVANTFLMYRIPIPILTWLGALVKVAYDRELSISEHRVKPADILHKSSIILGKQIIQILPEGSAVLNPEKKAFCLDASVTSIELPIQINQTTPISIELQRHDLDTDEVETIVIGSKQARKLKSEADRNHAKTDTNTPRTLHYSVSKKGIYQLSRVIDQSKLDVRKRSFDVAVVACPRASVSIDAKDKCTGDLSGVTLHVEGVPPFKVKYSKRVNQKQSSSIEQSIQPEDYEPQGDAETDDQTLAVSAKHLHRTWSRSRQASVQIDESLGQNGTWSYHIEEVEDGLANKATFDTDKVKRGSADEHEKSMTVHRRPVIKLNGCNSQHPLRVAQGASVSLPVQVLTPNLIPTPDWPMKLKYTFIAETDAEPGSVEEYDYEMPSTQASSEIHQAGRYNLESVSSQFCKGEVQEPSFCILHNPPRPDLTLQSEEIADKCAGNPVGMEVNLDFVGTPPFKVYYTVVDQRGSRQLSKHFDSMRGQLLFYGRTAGSYVYQINEIEDQVYGKTSLKDRNLELRQDIKPSADAVFDGDSETIMVCLGQAVSLPVLFQGEGPWDLEYEVVHGVKRKKLNLRSDSQRAQIDLPEQSDGGQYAVVLTSVQDRTRCKQILTDERVISVRAERPSVGFGDVEGRRSVKVQEGVSVKLPVRLQGVGPWTVLMQNSDQQGRPREIALRNANDIITVPDSGTYELVSVRDRQCPGLVDPKANKFEISWIQRPALKLKDSSLDHLYKNIYQKQPVCQGDEDTLSLALTGNPPYRLKYGQKVEPLRGSAVVTNKDSQVASNSISINMDTSKAGEVTYTFNELGDSRYPHSSRHFTQTTIKQQIYALPAAQFATPGKVYSYCKEDPGLASSNEGDIEQIAILLTGTPPFSIEVAISHHGTTQRPETSRIKDIPSNTYSWPISRGAFDLGTHNLQIRSVKDGRGCESIFDAGSSSVRIHVSSPPTILPLESATDYCVGDRVSFSLSGQAPFTVFYTFQNREKKAQVTSNDFRRIAESPGEFVITGVSDSAMGGSGQCKATKNIQKTIHPYPSVKISQGRTMISDIHEGGEVDIHFEFTGTPPFEFTYTRSENARRGDKKKPAILETRHDTSDEFTKTIRASEEGTYEVVAIKDRYCAYSAITGARSLVGGGGGKGVGWKDQKMLKNG